MYSTSSYLDKIKVAVFTLSFFILLSPQSYGEQLLPDGWIQGYHVDEETSVLSTPIAQSPNFIVGSTYIGVFEGKIHFGNILDSFGATHPWIVLKAPLNNTWYVFEIVASLKDAADSCNDIINPSNFEGLFFKNLIISSGTLLFYPEGSYQCGQIKVTITHNYLEALRPDSLDRVVVERYLQVRSGRMKGYINPKVWSHPLPEVPDLNDWLLNINRSLKEYKDIGCRKQYGLPARFDVFGGTATGPNSNTYVNWVLNHPVVKPFIQGSLGVTAYGKEFDVDKC